MRQVLKVSRSLVLPVEVKYPKTTRKIEDRDLKQKIVEIQSNSRKDLYGSPRIHQKLLREGYQVNKKRVERLMRETGIHAIAKKKYRELLLTLSTHCQ